MTKTIDDIKVIQTAEAVGNEEVTIKIETTVIVASQKNTASEMVETEETTKTTDSTFFTNTANTIHFLMKKSIWYNILLVFLLITALVVLIYLTHEIIYNFKADPLTSVSVFLIMFYEIIIQYSLYKNRRDKIDNIICMIKDKKKENIYASHFEAPLSCIMLYLEKNLALILYLAIVFYAFGNSPDDIASYATTTASIYFIAVYFGLSLTAGIALPAPIVIRRKSSAKKVKDRVDYIERIYANNN